MTGILREERIGPHRLILGDCLEVMPGLGRVDAVVTDPPYGIFAHGGKWGRKADLLWDKTTPDLELVLAAAPQHIIWGGELLCPSAVARLACLVQARQRSECRRS